MLSFILFDFSHSSISLLYYYLSSLISLANPYYSSFLIVKSFYNAFLWSYASSICYYFYYQSSLIPSIAVLARSIFSSTSAFVISYSSNFLLSSSLIYYKFSFLASISPYKSFIISFFLAISSVAYCISLSYSPIELVSAYLSFYNLVNSLFRLSKSICERLELLSNSQYYLFYISLNISCLDLFIIAYW